MARRVPGLRQSVGISSPERRSVCSVADTVPINTSSQIALVRQRQLGRNEVRNRSAIFLNIADRHDHEGRYLSMRFCLGRLGISFPRTPK